MQRRVVSFVPLCAPLEAATRKINTIQMDRSFRTTVCRSCFPLKKVERTQSSRSESAVCSRHDQFRSLRLWRSASSMLHEIDRDDSQKNNHLRAGIVRTNMRFPRRILRRAFGSDPAPLERRTYESLRPPRLHRGNRAPECVLPGMIDTSWRKEHWLSPVGKTSARNCEEFDNPLGKLDPIV